MMLVWSFLVELLFAADDQLIDEDDDEDDEMSDLLSGDGSESSSVSDNEF